MLTKLEAEQRKATQTADAELLNLSNKVKYLEGQLANKEVDTVLQRSETSQKEDLNR